MQVLALCGRVAPGLRDFLPQLADYILDFAAIFLFNGNGLAVIFDGVFRDGVGNFAECLGGDTHNFGKFEVSGSKFIELRNKAA